MWSRTREIESNLYVTTSLGERVSGVKLRALVYWCGGKEGASPGGTKFPRLFYPAECLMKSKTPLGLFQKPLI